MFAGYEEKFDWQSHAGFANDSYDKSGMAVDRLNVAQRSAAMSKIARKNTRPELVVRRAAHALGLRFRLHRRDLPGTPDLVFPRLRKALFVHGCFWHRHEGCRLAYNPRSNREFWEAKFARNVARDARVLTELREAGWDAEVIWECETRQPDMLPSKLKALIGGRA